MSSSKGRRPGPSDFGAANKEDDTPATLRIAPSTAGTSARIVSVPPLTSLCTRVFAVHYHELAELKDSQNESYRWEKCTQMLRSIPDSFLPRILNAIITWCPRSPRPEHLTTYFMRGESVTLTPTLSVRKETITALARCNSLRRLELLGLGQISDAVFASAVKNLKHLKQVSFARSPKVGPSTISSLAKSAVLLEALDISFTGVTPVSLYPLLRSCTSLKTLKASGCLNWTDATFSKLLSQLGTMVFLELTSVKFSQNQLSDKSFTPFLNRCPSLKRLDISFTGFRKNFVSGLMPALEKLNLTATFVNGQDLLRLLSSLNSMRNISLGSLGTDGKKTFLNGANLTLVDSVLGNMAATFNMTPLQKVNLAGNTKLGTSRGALRSFIRCIRNTCIELNLALTNTHSADLEGLVSEDPQTIPPLKSLNLSSTSVDDEVIQWISACLQLSNLEVAQTKVTSEGVLMLIDTLTNLQNIDVTGCRGVQVADRRHMFKIWEENHLHSG